MSATATQVPLRTNISFIARANRPTVGEVDYIFYFWNGTDWEEFRVLWDSVNRGEVNGGNTIRYEPAAVRFKAALVTKDTREPVAWSHEVIVEWGEQFALPTATPYPSWYIANWEYIDVRDGRLYFGARVNSTQEALPIRDVYLTFRGGEVGCRAKGETADGSLYECSMALDRLGSGQREVGFTVLDGNGKELKNPDGLRELLIDPCQVPKDARGRDCSSFVPPASVVMGASADESTNETPDTPTLGTSTSVSPPGADSTSPQPDLGDPRISDSIAQTPTHLFLEASDTTVDLSVIVLLTAQADSDVGPTSYSIAIVDEAGNVVAECDNGSKCSTPVSKDHLTTGSYRAFIGAGSEVLLSSNVIEVTWAAPAETGDTLHMGLPDGPFGLRGFNRDLVGTFVLEPVLDFSTASLYSVYQDFQAYELMETDIDNAFKAYEHISQTDVPRNSRIEENVCFLYWRDSALAAEQANAIGSIALSEVVEKGVEESAERVLENIGKQASKKFLLIGPVISQVMDVNDMAIDVVGYVRRVTAQAKSMFGQYDIEVKAKGCTNTFGYREDYATLP